MPLGCPPSQHVRNSLLSFVMNAFANTFSYCCQPYFYTVQCGTWQTHSPISVDGSRFRGRATVRSHLKTFTIVNLYSFTIRLSNYNILPSLDINPRWLRATTNQRSKETMTWSCTPIIRFSTRLFRVGIELYYSQHPKVDITEGVLSYLCHIWLFSMQLRAFNFIWDQLQVVINIWMLTYWIKNSTKTWFSCVSDCRFGF